MLEGIGSSEQIPQRASFATVAFADSNPMAFSTRGTKQYMPTITEDEVKQLYAHKLNTFRENTNVLFDYQGFVGEGEKEAWYAAKARWQQNIRDKMDEEVLSALDAEDPDRSHYFRFEPSMAANLALAINHAQAEENRLHSSGAFALRRGIGHPTLI
jgi:hypothetical protein